MKDKILVFGGSGFIGSEVCKNAVLNQLEVISISQMGHPPESDDWMEKVTWVQADIFNVKEWNSYLQEAKAVVHCIGIVKEYPEKGVTYDRINGETAIILAKEAAKAGVPKMCFMSAALKPPRISDHYLTAKREAEKVIKSLNIGYAIFRPGPIYGKRQPMAAWQRTVINLLAKFPLPTDFFKKARPIEVEVVGEALFKAALNPDIEGIFTNDEIRKIKNC
jgi:uncharacterized protein YbjT (DUF2867 family)